MIMVDTILDRFVYRHGQIVHFPCIFSDLCYEYSIIFQCLTSLLKSFLSSSLSQNNLCSVSAFAMTKTQKYRHAQDAMPDTCVFVLTPHKSFYERLGLLKNYILVCECIRKFHYLPLRTLGRTVIQNDAPRRWDFHLCVRQNILISLFQNCLILFCQISISSGLL